MAENRRFYYLKLKENFYNSETMVVLESMPDGLLYSNLLLKMYLMSLKSGGILMLNVTIQSAPQVGSKKQVHFGAESSILQARKKWDERGCL